VQVLHVGDLTADRIGDRIRWNPVTKITALGSLPLQRREPDSDDESDGRFQLDP
jgi:hypothetical protein